MRWDEIELPLPADWSTEEELQAELIELRSSVALAIGRHQYAYDLLDTALESGHLESMRRAKLEFEMLDEDTRSLILHAAGSIS